MLRAGGELVALLAWAYVAAAAQTTLAPSAELWAVTPDLLLVSAAVWVTAGRADVSGPRGAAAFGLVSDLISPGPLGIGMAVGFCLGVAVLYARRKLAGDALVVRLLLASAYVAAASAAMALVYALAGSLTLTPALACARTLGAALYSVVLAVACIALLPARPAAEAWE